jgi:hypothetical protein
MAAKPRSTHNTDDAWKSKEKSPRFKASPLLEKNRAIGTAFRRSVELDNAMIAA